jgi:hypothetical protein
VNWAIDCREREVKSARRLFTRRSSAFTPMFLGVADPELASRM